MTHCKPTKRRAQGGEHAPRATRRARGLKVLLACAIALAAIGVGAVSTGAHQRVKPPKVLQGLLPVPPGGDAQPAARPNIVFVLTDDLSMDLLRYMPRVQAMERHGLTFENYFVSDSLCCPSRSSIFTGNFPHDTHVFTNFGREGGFHAFYEHGDQNHTFALALQRAGYRTGMMGKYLNGYMDAEGAAIDGSSASAVGPTYVPPGWSEWDVAGWGYPEFNYRMNEDGSIHEFGDLPSDYLTDVMAGRGVDFINRAAAADQPFFLELATFAPHYPYTPAPQDAADFPGLRVPRPLSFNRLPTHAPSWLRNHHRLGRKQLARINTVFRLRAQDVQSVDRMIGRVEAALRANGIARDTYLVFSSDNGLHTGQYRLMPGKLTAFDTDIHVPLVVVGPGVSRGARTRRDDRERRPRQDLRPVGRHDDGRRRPQPRAPASGRDAGWVAERRADRASRPAYVAARSRLPAAGQRQPVDVRGDADARVPIRRVRGRRARVLRPTPRPVRAPQHRLPPDPRRAFGAARRAARDEAMPRRSGVLDRDARFTARGTLTAPRERAAPARERRPAQFISPRVTARHASHSGHGGFHG